MSKTIEFFKEISTIPRKSGNEEKIADYLVSFATKRNLFYQRDSYNNVLIKKKNSNLPCIILQAHTDMVCVSDNKDFDFKKNKIEVIEKDGYLSAKNTTLGADNGIGVAMILNILDSDIPCNIEAVFTTSEETTMVGAMNFDTTSLKGECLLNLDGFAENTILIESASFYDLIINKKKETMVPRKEKTFNIKLSGLLGGHSGYDIDKNRGNAMILLAELLNNLDIDLVEFKGGTKNNVLPSSASAIINISENNINKEIESFLEKYKSLYKNLKIDYEEIGYSKPVYKDTKKYLEFIINFPSKAIYYNENNEVTTSINLGVVKDNYMEIGLRSSRKDEAESLLQELSNYANDNDFNLKQDGYQPGFCTSKESNLVKRLLNSNPYLVKPQVSVAHITVEAGFFQEKMPSTPVAIISPKILNAHSTLECVSINSIDLVDKWLLNFINDYK